VEYTLHFDEEVPYASVKLITLYHTPPYFC